MELTQEGIHFNPMLPDWVGNEIKLRNFKYRDAILNISVKVKELNSISYGEW